MTNIAQSEIPMLKSYLDFLQREYETTPKGAMYISALHVDLQHGQGAVEVVYARCGNAPEAFLPTETVHAVDIVQFESIEEAAAFLRTNAARFGDLYHPEIRSIHSRLNSAMEPILRLLSLNRDIRVAF